MVIVTLWSTQGLAAAWAKARAALGVIRPHVVELHGSPSLLKAQAPAVAAQVRDAIPGTRIWLGVAGDAGHTDVAKGKLSLADLRARRLGVAATLRASGAERPLLNCEGYWKPKARPKQGGFDEAAAAQWVADLQAALPGVPIEHSAYAAPRGHMGYPWRGFLGADRCARSWFQLYEIHAHADAEHAVARLRESVAECRAKGIVGPECIAAPYLQMHHGTTTDPATGQPKPYGTDPRAASWMADQFDDATFWAAGDRMDEAGIRLAAALVEIERRGFVGAGRVARFQASAGLTPDSQIGPRTFAALGMP